MERVSSQFLSLCHRQAAVAPHELISSFCLSRFDTRAGKISPAPRVAGRVAPSGDRHADASLDAVHGNVGLEMLDVGVFEKQAAAQAFICKVHSLCVHGDEPTAVELARTVREGLEKAGVNLVPLTE